MERTGTKPCAIAVIGLGCWYPDARGVRELWENVLARRRAFRRIPEQRLPLSEYYDADRAAADKTYANRAAVIDGFSFDWINRRIPKSTAESTDIVHWLALEVALRALDDAHVPPGAIPADRAGVILGNTLTGEHTRAQTMRLRWPYVRRALRAAAEAKGMQRNDIARLAETMEHYYKSVFAAVTEDTLAGGLSNTIAGRICNTLDFHGGGYTVDGACASSLIAVATAANALTNGELDFALAGGVDISLDTFELVGFAKTNALTSEDMAVYDRRASGFIPGEGCGFVVLKRLADARRDGNAIYAVVRGWGVSSDGRGAITAPNARQQAAALRRAWRRAGYLPSDVAFIEGHGTGTTVGDAAELEGIALARGKDCAPRSCGVTSLKSIIGHTKAASGIGGFIKTVAAVNRRIIPPTAGCSDPHRVFDGAARSLYPVLRGEARPRKGKLRAGVTGAGFGGINCHIALESYGAPDERLAPVIDERALRASAQEAELFVFSALSPAALFERIRATMRRAQGMSSAELPDLAALLTAELDARAPVRAAVIADSPAGLLERLRQLNQMAATGFPAKGAVISTPRRDITLGNGAARPRVAFLFPGQGSQQLNMARMLVERYAWARDMIAGLGQTGLGRLPALMFRPVERAADERELNAWFDALTDTAVAQPAICVASVLWLRHLERLGVMPSAVGGHSLGELAAFHAAGAMDERALLRFAALRGRAMAKCAGHAGAMAVLACPRGQAEDLVRHESGHVVVANINGMLQTVISGERPCVAHAVERAKAAGIAGRVLAAGGAFHSKFVSAAAETIRAHARLPEVCGPLAAALYSSVDGRRVVPGLHMRKHFADQVTAPVDFVALVRSIAKESDLIIEAGPGRVLTDLAASITGPGGPACLPVESRAEHDRDLAVALGAYFAHGGDVNWEVLYENRLLRPFVPASSRQFIDNPLERPFNVPAGADSEAAIALPPEPARAQRAETRRDATTPRAAGMAAHAALFAVVSSRTGFPVETLSPGMRLLEDLNLDSIKAAEAVAETARQLNVAGRIDATAFARGRLGDVASALEQARGAAAPADVSALLFELIAARTGFPRESLTPRMRLLEDLNLDSIKAADLVGEAARRLSIAGKLESAQLPGATIESAAAVLQRLLDADAGGQAAPAPPARPCWVRSFVMEAAEEPLPAQDARAGTPRTPGATLIVRERGEDELARGIAAHCVKHGGRARAITFAAAASLTAAQRGAYKTVVAVLPRQARPEPALEDAIARLHTIVSLLPAPDGESALACVQFGGGYAGDEHTAPAVGQCCASALLASAHHERPGVNIKVIDCAADADAKLLAGCIVRELCAMPHGAVGYDAALTRRVLRPRIFEPSAGAAPSVRLSSEDVLIVTGGAKGITAECAFGLAKATGARMALVGSSPSGPGDAGRAISRTLERYRAAGLACAYYQCDITSSAATAALVQRVARELGAVTGVIHGAALNTPRRLEQATADEALREVAPKVRGAVNLCAALAKTPLRMFTGLTSIIGITGMPGNGWYGFSNEALDAVLAQYARRNPRTAVRTIAFSVWSDVGMGARMGSTDMLARMGIEAIPPAEGVRRFISLATRRDAHRQIAVAARFTGLDTWQPAPCSQPDATGFLDDIVSHYPGIETVARTTLTLERDAYLEDHVWQGSHLFPAVFGLEAMAQAAAHAAGIARFGCVSVEHIKLERPIIVTPGRGLGIEIRAEVLEGEEGNHRRRIRAGITTEQSGYTAECFSAEFALREGVAAPHDVIRHPPAPLDIDPRDGLYGWLLFQGARFRRIERIELLDAAHCVFRSSHNAPEGGVAGPHGSRTGRPWMLGDPYFRDSLLQSLQLTVPRDACLPVRIERIDVCDAGDTQPASRLCRTVLEERRGDVYRGSVAAVDTAGAPVELVTGYEARVLHHHDDYPRPEDIAAPDAFDRDAVCSLARHYGGQAGVHVPHLMLVHAPGIHRLGIEERRAAALPLLRATVSAALHGTPAAAVQPSVTWLESGKPAITGENGGYDVSLSHDDTTVLCVAGAGAQGCDIAPVTPRTRDEWLGILGAGHAALLDELCAGADSLDDAGTRVWAAIEAARKASGSPGTSVALDRRHGPAVLFTANGADRMTRVMTFPVRCARGTVKMIALTVRHAEQPAGAESPAPARAPHALPPRIAALADALRERVGVSGVEITAGAYGQPVSIVRFPVSFKEAANPSRTLYFSNYFAWMGKLRELMIQPVSRELVSLFSSGAWGMVTNCAGARIFGEATCGDIIEGRLWLGGITGAAHSSLDLCFEWARLHGDGRREQIATSSMRTTWVRVGKNGAMDVHPLPPFLEEYMRHLLPPGPHEPAPPPPAGGDEQLGSVLHRAQPDPSRRASLLAGTVFDTSLEDANLVGNVYFANYYAWQGRVRDWFLHEALKPAPGVAPAGEFRCRRCTVDHLGEAMPFDRIAVRLSRADVHERGARFLVDYYRLAPGHAGKLAHGEHEAVWCAPDATNNWRPAPLPAALRDALLSNDPGTPLVPSALPPDAETDDGLTAASVIFSPSKGSTDSHTIRTWQEPRS